MIETEDPSIKVQGHSCYMKVETKGKVPSQMDRPRVLLLDDDPMIFHQVKKIMPSSDYEIVYFDSLTEADKFIESNTCDLLLLDVFLKSSVIDEWVHCLRRNGQKEPILLFSSSSKDKTKVIMDLLQESAQDFIDKAKMLNEPDVLRSKVDQLIKRNRKQAPAKTESAIQRKNKRRISNPDMILIGASTGGTNALSQLLRDLPKPCPPIVVVQHITNEFLGSFAQRLSQVSGLTLGDGRHGEPLKKNTIYMAKSDQHIGLLKRGKDIVIRISNEPPRASHRPSVDVLFESACEIGNRVKMAAFILTGMGADGAKGMKKLKDINPNVVTYAESEESCVVFGMPKEAIALGCVDNIGSLEQLRIDLINSITASQQPAELAS